MTRIAALGLVLALTVMGLTACDGDGDDGITVDATGSVLGIVWLDRNGNAELDGTDSPVRDVRVQLIPAVGGEAAYSGETGAAGEFVIQEVLVGDYTVDVDATTLGDTLQVLTLDGDGITVEAGDSTIVSVGLSYPAVPIDSARREPVETRVFIEGIVLTRWGAFGEATLHVRDTTGAIRVVRAQPVAVVPGDSVRVLGTMGVQTGQPVIRDGATFIVRTGIDEPAPDTVTTGLAATADGGRLDADLIHLDSAVVQDTSRNAAGERILTVDDGTGPVNVLFDRDVAFFLSFPDGFIGTILELTGVLVPATPGGDWILKPRSTTDVVVGPLAFPTVDIADARTEPADTRVVVEGRVLNTWSTFADSTVHVRDPSGAIRAVRLPSVGFAEGDSVRMVATIGTALGQPVLTDVEARRLATASSAPVPLSVSTATAANGDGGDLDAQLVVVAGAEVQDTARTGAGELFLRVNDGSGDLDVVLDDDIAFFVDFGGPILGASIQVRGLLLPDPEGPGWVMKPRRSADFVVE